MPAGRPSLYRPDYCRTVADFQTLTEFARHIGVAFQTVHVWIHVHPDFAQAVKTMTRRRKPRYSPDYCEAVVDCLKDGHSLAAFAGRIGADRRTLYRWMDKHPAFADAVKRAQAKSALWWDRRLLEVALSGRGPAKAIMLGVRNRAREEWRDRPPAQGNGKTEPITRIVRVIVTPPSYDE